MTKHKTFPAEQPEMPLPDKKPEIKQPHDPHTPETPEEAPQHEPEELPPGNIPPMKGNDKARQH
ncbi:hypothetical protein BC343_00185 [Mucilaginibacter pedocola]|uniref:Uncharacterized protein n=1 Tax=Mucilaginibacter pedocola TaxID=1792845 RepID=A0A1S9PKQ8_9SPHI|nr:hypothetical protein BC343_00185 [Mucilaginibacter pedocola]